MSPQAEAVRIHLRTLPEWGKTSWIWRHVGALKRGKYRSWRDVPSDSDPGGAAGETDRGDRGRSIAERKTAKIVMIAGPSSSGKTTFSHRLSVQLEAIGLKPHPIAVDNYFVNRVDSPRDENGNYNYEVLECLDVEHFNQDMTGPFKGRACGAALLQLQKRSHGNITGNRLKLGEEDILVIEGIHCLNDRLILFSAKREQV